MFRMNRIIFSVFWLILLGIGQKAFSQDTTKVLKDVDVYHQDSMVLINFGRPIQPAFRIEKRTIDLFGATSVGDAVKIIPSVQLKDYGGNGGIQTINYRTLGGGHTSILSDSRLIQNFQVGSVDLKNQLIFGVQNLIFSIGEPVDRLVPATAYLPATILAINSIFTSHPQSPKAGVDLILTTVNSYNESVCFNLPLNSNWSMGLLGSLRHGNGQFPFLLESVAGDVQPETRQNTALLGMNGRFNLSYITSKTSFAFDVGGSRIDQELPGAVTLYNPFNDQYLYQDGYGASARLKHELSEKWNMFAYANYNQHYTRYLDEFFLNQAGFYEATYRQNVGASGLTFTRDFSNLLADDITLSTDFTFAHLEGASFDSNPTRFTNTAVAGIRKSIKRLKVSGNLISQIIFQDNQEGDRQDFFKLSPYVGLSYLWDKKASFKTRVFYKNTYRLPSFNELFYNQVGNPGLQPEDANLFNLGIQKSIRFPEVQWQGTMDVHYTHTKNKILAVPSKDLFNWSIQNVGETVAVGIDIGSSMRIPLKRMTLNLNTSHSLLQAKDVTEEKFSFQNDQLAYIPFYAANYSAELEFKKLSINSTMIYNGVRYTLSYVSIDTYLPSFIDWNFGIRKKLDFGINHIEVEAKIMNILGKNYEVIKSFPTFGRHFQFRLTYNLGS